MKFCIAAFRGNNSKISLEPQREGARLAVTEGLLETKKSDDNYFSTQRKGEKAQGEFCRRVASDDSASLLSLFANKNNKTTEPSRDGGLNKAIRTRRTDSILSAVFSEEAHEYYRKPNL